MFTVGIRKKDSGQKTWGYTHNHRTREEAETQRRVWADNPNNAWAEYKVIDLDEETS